jgi:hypothetical protein
MSVDKRLALGMSNATHKRYLEACKLTGVSQVMLLEMVLALPDDELVAFGKRMKPIAETQREERRKVKLAIRKSLTKQLSAMSTEELTAMVEGAND